MSDFDDLLAEHPELADLAAAAPDVDAEADPRRDTAPPPGMAVFAGQMIQTAHTFVEMPRVAFGPGHLEELRGRIGAPVCVHYGPRHVIGILLAVEQCADGCHVRLSLNELQGNV